MKSWRERIAEAETRGRFTRDDWYTWRLTLYCPAAEAARHCGLELYEHPKHEGAVDNDRLPGDWYGQLWIDLGELMGALITHNRFDEASQLLDAIEDRALQLKRERAG